MSISKKGKLEGNPNVGDCILQSNLVIHILRDTAMRVSIILMFTEGAVYDKL